MVELCLDGMRAQCRRASSSSSSSESSIEDEGEPVVSVTVGLRDDAVAFRFVAGVEGVRAETVPVASSSISIASKSVLLSFEFIDAPGAGAFPEAVFGTGVPIVA